MNALLKGFQALGDKDVFQGDIGAEGFALQFEKKAVLRRHGFKAPLSDFAAIGRGPVVGL
jgi:hypothetical protein